MANQTAPVSGISNSLQRGKACLRCRKRKMRCDGTKPACQQCIRAKKADCCEYDDGKGKTRTQILKETISRLENRIRELEDPDYISSTVILHDPHVANSFHHSESSSSLGSPASATYSASNSPFQPDTASPPSHWSGLPGTSTSAFASEMFYEEPHDTPPFDLAPVLLDIFAPHRYQAGLEVQMDNLKASLSLPSTEQRHPSLLNAIYLWACFVSRPDPLSETEDYFLAQALDAQQQGLRLADRMLDVIQASCLLALYFLANGRHLEGSYHSSAAAALALQLGLHLDTPRDSSGVMLDSHELYDAQRTLVFWQVYNLDRCWSVVLHRPSILPDGTSSSTACHCPWPQDIADYESGFADPSPSFRTLTRLLNGDVATGGFSAQALRAKASTLFSHADKLSRSWGSDTQDPASLQDQARTLEMTITTFLATITPVHQIDNSLLDNRQILITVHTLANTAMMLLAQRFTDTVGTSYDESVQAAHGVLAVIKCLSSSDFALLDPILGTCWSLAADILLRQLDALESSWPLVNTVDARNDLATLLFAMNSFNSHFPILNLSVSKVQERLKR